MMYCCRFGIALTVVLGFCSVSAAQWQRYRGPNGVAVSKTSVPVEWSSKKNIVWRAEMPGPGTSSPVVTGGRIYLTSYTGYGTDKGLGKMDDLRQHVVCVDRKSGKVLWKKQIETVLPERRYGGYMALHGYASSTPATDGKHLYCFFGKTGVFCFDLDGKQIWRKSVGKRTHGWGSATSPVLYKNLVIVNASVESGALVAFDKTTGEEKWRATGISSSWSTPALAKVGGKEELVVSGSRKVLGFDPDTGKELWHANSYTWYVCPSVVVQDGVVFGLQNSAAVAIKAGGRGDVTDTHTVWHKRSGSTVPSMVVHKGYVYYGNGSTVRCLKADSGETVYRESLSPAPRRLYGSPIIAGDKIYYISRFKGVYVVNTGPEFKQVAHNTFEDDASRNNSSPIVDDGCLLLRTDRYLYCIGKK